jgi:outer membrane protein TolC
MTFCLAITPVAAQRAAIHVGVILDGPSERNAAMQHEFQKQIAEFFGSEYDVRFTPENTLEGDWTVASVRVVVDRLLADKDVEFILALGPMGSHEIALRPNLVKPVIAGAVIDAALQGFPKKDGASGVKNLNYLDEAYSVARTIKSFQEIVSFKKLAVFISPGVLEAIPQLRDRAQQEVRTLGAQLEFVPATAAAATALQALPADADAVYIAPLLQMPASEFDLLVAGVNQRRLPSFSYLGRAEVEKGVMASYAPTNDLIRRARRIASNMQRILRGENAGAIPVDFSSASQLTINMATARAIGFYPNWKTLTEAKLLNQEEIKVGRTLSLATSVKEAVRVNLDMMLANKEVESGKQEVNKARANLLPQVNVSALGTLVGEKTAEASFGQQPERQLDGSLTFSQLLYSESARANFSIQKHLQAAREDDRRSVELDIALDAATAYLNVLRAKALSRIQRGNLKLTMSNLELARLRESVGASGRSDVYRWESEAATSRKNVIDADAQVEVAKIEMNRVLNRPLEETFATEETAVDDPILITGEKKLFAYFDNPQTFGVFRDFMVQEGVSAAPELQQLDAAIAAQRRAKTATSRAFWMPTIALQAKVNNVFSRSGAGSEGFQLPSSFPIPITFPKAQDLNWSVGLQVSLPLFTGLDRIAEDEQARVELDRLTLERESAQLAISQRIRSSMHVAGASHAGIEQARAAAEAARKNLELVTDAYRSGAVAIVTLLDAQNAALVADEAAANAVYGFLIDLMRVERAIGQFYFIRTEQEKQSYFNRLEEFYRKAGVAPERR